jgi:DNA-binding IclR family transcriptional regulator
MLMTQTALGRWVGLEDWETVQTDRILRTLFNISVMGGGPVKLETLARATGLTGSETFGLCQAQVNQGLVFDAYGDYVLTNHGRSVVQNLLAAQGVL